MSQITRNIFSSGPGGFVQTLTSNGGGAVGPDGANNINVVGGNNITGTGNPGTNTITFNVTGTTNHAIQVGNATGSLTSLAVAGNGQIPIGSAGADPIIANITAGSGISISNGAGSITISATDSVSWNEVLGITQAMLVDNGYVANNVALVTLTLPVIAGFGDQIRVAGKGAGLWRIAQNAGQTIHFGASNTTPGAGGSLTAINRYDCVELLCTTANTDWTVLSVQGNLTVV